MRKTGVSRESDVAFQEEIGKTAAATIEKEKSGFRKLSERSCSSDQSAR
jgi:hypothetical protein